MGPSVAVNAGQVVAFIDMGTYSVRLLIARLNPNRSYTILSELKEPSRLGVGEIFEQRLEQEAMLRTALICSKYKQMAEGFEAYPIQAVATAATRDARNKRQFLRLLQKEAKLDVRVISGKEEARLIYLGVSRGIHLDTKTALFIDIGGGSTELIVGNQREPKYLTSLAMGAIRLSQAFALNDPQEPINIQHYQNVCRHVGSAAVRAIQAISEQPVELCVGSSGSIMNLAEIAAKATTASGTGPGDEKVLRFDQLQMVTQMLCSLPLEQRKKVPGLNPSRADIILGGAAILESIMGQLGLEQIQISPRGLRDGLLIDFINRNEPDEVVTDHLSTRRQSVLLLGRRCGFDEQHALHVAHLAQQLFDSAKQVKLHSFSDKERELLQYAGLLHDIGVFLSFENHHAHTYYLIKNADLLGFDQTEVAMIAAIARYHRKGSPRKGHAEVADLTKSQTKMVYQLGVLLRLAESLDRSHGGVIQSATFTQSGKKDMSLEPVATDDCALEIWGVQKHVKAFEKAFGSKLTINLVTEPVDGQISGSTAQATSAGQSTTAAITSPK